MILTCRVCIGYHAMNHMRKCLKVTRATSGLVAKCSTKGNHNGSVWQQHSDRVHLEDKARHYPIECIVLELVGSVDVLLNAMHDVSR